MKGLRLKEKKTFHNAFSCIIKELDGLQWLLESDSINESSQEISQLFEEDVNWFFSNDNIIELYSKSINEDWNTMFGFKTEQVDIKKWAKAYWNQKEKAQYIINSCETIFINVDATYWEVYSNNDILLNTVKNNFNVIEFNNLSNDNPGI